MTARHHATGLSPIHEAYDYAERIRERLPRRSQELREVVGLSMDALWLKCGCRRTLSAASKAVIPSRRCTSLRGWRMAYLQFTT